MNFRLRFGTNIRTLRSLCIQMSFWTVPNARTHTLCLCTCIVHNFKVKYIFNVARMLEQCECQTFLYVWRAQHTHTYMHGKKNENEGNGMLQMPFVYLSIDMQRCILTPAKCFLRRLIERWNNMDFKSTLNIVLLPIFTFSNIGQTLWVLKCLHTKHSWKRHICSELYMALGVCVCLCRIRPMKWFSQNKTKETTKNLQMLCSLLNAWVHLCLCGPIHTAAMHSETFVDDFVMFNCLVYHTRYRRTWITYMRPTQKATYWSQTTKRTTKINFIWCI